jgi:serine/threonine protein kinase
MPFGNLEDEHRRVPFTDDECVQILHQSLSALVYLHGQPEPVAHRDIKPENILVKYRDPDCNPDHLHIKLSDFGLSKAGSLKTWCGTPSYLAPEVQDEDTPQRKYTTAVDIWSLGVVILRLAYELPYPGSGNGAWWCERIAEEANGWESEGLIDVVQRMLVVDPKGRCSAEAGFQDTSQLLASAQDRSATPTPASGAPGYSPAANSDLTSSSIDEEALYEIWRNLESDAPPPEATKETAATTKKRTARTSKTSSASSSRRNTKRHMSTTVPHPESVGYPEESAVYVGPQTTSEWSSLAADEYSDAADQQAPAVVAVGATETTPSLRSDFLAGDTAAYVPPQTDAYSQYTESNGSNGSYLAPAGKSYEELLA